MLDAPLFFPRHERRLTRALNRLGGATVALSLARVLVPLQCGPAEAKRSSRAQTQAQASKSDRGVVLSR
jgi:hypothetical protein